MGRGTEFWDLYVAVLTMIAGARDDKGNPNFEAHRVTRFYEEVIQATQGSNWVLCMTLASSAEGLVNMLPPPKGKLKVDNYLKDLVQRGVLTDDHQKSWTTVRHAVMHGKLVSPWSTEDEDKRILNLADLVHRLTRELIRDASSSDPSAADQT